MHTSKFFKFFPPPKFLAMKHAGLDISDDAVHCLGYVSTTSGIRIEKYARMDLPVGLVDDGDIKDEEALVKLLAAFNKENKLTYVKVSIPEEKAYLFQTDVPGVETKIVRQNIEFKLEENVPVAAAEALFYYDLLPMPISGGTLRASVSVVTQAYVERYISILNRAGMTPVAFEVVPKSIARAIISQHERRTYIVVYMMEQKTGLYVVSEGVVCFTSTVDASRTQGTDTDDRAYITNISKEVNRVYQYWISHGGAEIKVESIIIAGRSAPRYESLFQNIIVDVSVPVQRANVWNNVLDINKYVPPISLEDSLGYAVAAGLALPFSI